MQEKNLSQYLSPGLRISMRGEDFLITNVEDNHGKSKLVEAEGISEVVRGKTFKFDTAIDSEIQVLNPLNTKLVADNSASYLKTKLFLEAHIRNASFNSSKIEIGHKAAINPADFQFTPTIKSLTLPRPRMLIADAVGLGKTIEVGIFLAEQIKRGKGKRILVLALKSILTQFQQEMWSRFAIPLVRLDSIGIQRIKAELPANKNPFDYYDKTIISIDTLKNNAKFRHYIEKSHWDIIVIDECHTVANITSQRGDLAQYLATKCESIVLTSATPHNGSKESFANLITMIEPIAIPKVGEYTKQDVQKYYVRRFKKDLGKAVQENFKDRKVIIEPFLLNADEEKFFLFQQNLKIDALKRRQGDERPRDLLFSIGLFKAYLSSPEACLETIENKIKKFEESADDLSLSIEKLNEAKTLVERVIKNGSDSKYNRLLEYLKSFGWQGRASDPRIIIFAERIKTLEKLCTQLKEKFNLDTESIKRFDGSSGLSDVEQQELIDDFGKEDSKIRLLLASNVGSQGVNLHFYCNIMFNYDVPWSIITLEQRNGRIDRYGQKKNPNIYYLISESKDPKIKADLRIIEKLGKKEDEIHRVLGDSASFLKKYDSEKEEQAVEDMIITGDSSILDKSLTDFKWESIFGNEQETTEIKVDDNPITSRTTFYTNDFDFYKTLVQNLTGEGAIQQRNINIDHNLIEILNDKDIDSYLYDIPPEAKPKRGEFYKLTSEKDIVQQSIEKSRKKKGEWAEFQVLYDLHPIVKIFMNKLEASIDKDVALVVKTEKLLKDARWYVFHGQIANNLGQSILSEFFVVGLTKDGSFIKFLDFDQFITENNLADNLINQNIDSSALDSLKKTLPEAIKNAESHYLNPKQASIKRELEAKQNEYKNQLDEWENISKEQLKLEFEDKAMTIFSKTSKEKKQKQIETILSDKSQFYKDLTSLDNNPYIKLLAVFFN